MKSEGKAAVRNPLTIFLGIASCLSPAALGQDTIQDYTYAGLGSVSVSFGN